MMIINILGLVIVALIVWWFWLYKPKEVSASDDTIVVTVENGTYSPARIKWPADKPVHIQFIRKDESPCAATVLFPELEVNQELPMGKSKTISLSPLSKGEYAFHCQMQMYRGTLIVD